MCLVLLQICKPGNASCVHSEKGESSSDHLYLLQAMLSPALVFRARSKVGYGNTCDHFHQQKGHI